MGENGYTDEEFENLELEEKLKKKNIRKFSDEQLQDALVVAKSARRIKPEKKSKDPAPAAAKKKEVIEEAKARLAEHGLEL